MKSNSAATNGDLSILQRSKPQHHGTSPACLCPSFPSLYFHYYQHKIAQLYSSAHSSQRCHSNSSPCRFPSVEPFSVSRQPISIYTYLVCTRISITSPTSQIKYWSTIINYAIYSVLLEDYSSQRCHSNSSPCRFPSVEPFSVSRQPISIYTYLVCTRISITSPTSQIKYWSTIINYAIYSVLLELTVLAVCLFCGSFTIETFASVIYGHIPTNQAKSDTETNHQWL